MYDILLFESDLGTLDTSNLELAFSCSASQPCTILILKRCMADVVEKRQNFNGVRKSLFAVYLENTLSKKNSYILFENWIWGHGNILTLEGQKGNF